MITQQNSIRIDLLQQIVMQQLLYFDKLESSLHQRIQEVPKFVCFEVLQSPTTIRQLFCQSDHIVSINDCSLR